MVFVALGVTVFGQVADLAVEDAGPALSPRYVVSVVESTGRAKFVVREGEVKGLVFVALLITILREVAHLAVLHAGYAFCGRNVEAVVFLADLASNVIQ